MTLPKGTVLRADGSIDIPEISPDGRWVAYAATVSRTPTTAPPEPGIDRVEGARRRQRGHSRSGRQTAARWASSRREASRPSRLAAARRVSWRRPRWGLGARGPRVAFCSPRRQARDLKAAGLYTIPETGGTPARVEIVPPPEGSAYVLPRLLPDGRSFLTSTYPQRSLRLASLDSQESRLVTEVDGPTAPLVRFAAGHLLWARGEQLVRRAFDPRSGQFTEPEVPLAQGAGTHSVASDGTIVFQTRSSSPFRSRRGSIAGACLVARWRTRTSTWACPSLPMDGTLPCGRQAGTPTWTCGRWTSRPACCPA